MRTTIHQTEVELVQGDIIIQDVDAILNAANCGLSGSDRNEYGRGFHRLPNGNA